MGFFSKSPNEGRSAREIYGKATPEQIVRRQIKESDAKNSKGKKGK